MSDPEDHPDYPKFNWLIYGGVSAFFALGILFTEGIPADPEQIFFTSVGIAFMVAFYYWVYLFIMRTRFRNRLAEKIIQGVEDKSEKLQENLEADFFNTMLKINFTYLDKYYLQTQVQAGQAFALSAMAAVVGLLIIIAGIAQMYLGQTEPAYVTTAAGLISEFIAATFFYLYTRTVLKMSDYHNKLVLTQNVSLAMRIAEDQPEPERTAAKALLIDRLSKDINDHLSVNSPEPAK